MARSATKAAGESDVTAAGEKTLDFDDVTLRGEKKQVTIQSTTTTTTTILFYRYRLYKGLVPQIARKLVEA